MQCASCGLPVGEEETRCPHCGKTVSPVSVLSPNEREAFNGVTIDQDGDRRSDDRQDNSRERIYFRHVYVGGNSKWSGLVTLLIVGFIIAAFLFFALPVILLLTVSAVILWFIKQLFF